ncbi:MAG: hypothetical protein ACFBSD_04355 [Paracoccaceae bacterium]
MDPTTAAGTAVAVSKLAFFAFLVWQSRKATAAVREMEAEKAARARTAALAAELTRTPDAAEPTPAPCRTREPA